MGREQFVSVTHFINPQLFWYHKIDVPNEHFHRIIQLEEQLKDLFKNKNVASSYRPTVEDLVAVKFLSWNKCIRGRIEEIVQFRSSCTEYIVWATDYGFPFQTKFDYIRSLPEELTIHVDHIRQGSLAFLLPGEKEFDFMEGKAKMSILDHWCQRACDSLEKLISDAASVTFIEYFQLNRSHFWGDLKIVNHNGISFLASEYLIGINMAVEQKTNFREMCSALQCIQTPRWLSNSRNNKFKQNVLNPTVINRRKNAVEQSCDDFSKQKVEDWCARNERFGGSESFLIHNEVSASSTIDNNDVSVDEIGFEDSMSVKHEPLYKIPLDTQGLDETEQRGFMRSGGMLMQFRKHCDIKNFPKPPASAFEIHISDGQTKDDNPKSELSISNFNSQNISESVNNTSASPHKQMLIAMRKKLASNRSVETDSILSAINNLEYQKLNTSTSDEASTLENTNRSERLSEVRKKLLSKRGSVVAAEEYQASTELVSSSTEKCNKASLQNVRAKQLLEIRRKYEASASNTSSTNKFENNTKSTVSSNVTNESGDQSKKDSTDKEDVSSNISIGSNSTFTSLLKAIREKRIRENQNATNMRNNNNKEDNSRSTSNAAASSYMETLKGNKQSVNNGAKETINVQKECNNHDKEDTMSVISSAASSYIESLKNTRKKVQERRVGNLQNIATNNNQADYKFVDLRIDKCSKNYTNSNQKSSDPYEGITMLPAGFDLGKLCIYKDEENHWHRKKTTRNDIIPHDLNKNYELSSNNTKTSDDIWDMNESDDTKTSKAIKEQSSSNQNFRHTRSHTDKFKGGNFCELSIHNLNIEKLKHFEKSLLDTTIPDINTDTLMPIIGDHHITNTRENEKIDTIDKNLINLNSTVEDTPPSTDISAQSTYLRKYRRRTLKPPAQQMDKMEQLLKRAKLEKELGNTEILDLDASNLNGRSDSDTNSGVETSGSTFLESHSSNSTNYIVAMREKGEQKYNRNSQLDDSNDAKLEKLAQQLHKELDLSNENKCKILETVIKLPQAQQIREISGERKLQTKFIDHMVLAHSKVPQNPLEKLTDAFLLPEIQEEMINMRVTKVYRIQAYSWPHLLRGNSLFVVNPIKSGKTWCYIPAICNLVSYRLQNSSLPQAYGPVAIIMVGSARHVENLNNYCRRLLINSKTKITTVPAFGFRNSTEAKIELLNSCGILVATPAYLARLLKDNEKESLIDPERLQHFIIDDLDLILLRFKKDFDTVVRGILKMARKPHQHTVALQVIVTSRDWNPVMMSMIRWANQPLLLIGDFLEAAVYGKASISVKLRSNEKKMGSVLRFIEQHPVDHERLLICCNCDDDMKYVVRTLIESGHACIGYGSDSGPEAVHLRIAIEEWKNKILSSQILVCTDSALPDLKLRNAQNLIHYSMPTSWTKFTTRFASLAENYENLISTDFLRSQHYKTYSLILLDEDNNIQLPRLIDFMKKHNQIKNIHPNILVVSKRVLVEREELRIFKGALLCPILLEFGDCDEPRCDNRHNLTRFDLIAKNDDIPTEGDIRIQILKVFSPTWYSARLLSHKTSGSSKWKIIRRSDEAALFGIKLNMHYMDMNNWITHWPPKINDICIYKTSSETYQRARILDVPHIQYPDIIKVINVTIKLIDLGTIISSCKSDELLVCDKQFKDFPFQAIDVRLMGVVPFDNERTWDSKATKVVQRWIMSDINEKECIHANINFALANTVWVENVIVMERLPTVREYIYRINLKRSLVQKNFGVCDKAVQCRLKAMQEEVNKLQDANLNDDQEMNFNIQQTSPIKQVIGGENGNTELDSINLIQFSPRDQDLSNSKEKKVETKKCINMTKEAMGVSDLISERGDIGSWDEMIGSNSNMWIESFISNESNIIDKSKTTHTFENTNSISTTKEILKKKTEHFKPEEKWCRLPLNKIAGVEIGDENENGNWCDIYMQCIDEYQMQQFHQLNALINKHIENLKKLNEKKPAFDSYWLQPKQNCIVKYDNLYCRAKIYGIFGKEIGKQIYRFFLCDYACFVTVNAEDLFSDFLYETSCEIIEYTPYQAVHCKLAGITLKPFCKRHLVTKDYLYACAVQERTAMNGELADFEIFSYDILLYECDKGNDFTSATLFNMTLIDNNVATVDPATKHFLERPSPFAKFLTSERKPPGSNETGKNLRDELVSFEEFLEIFNNLSEDDSEDALDIVFDFKRKAEDIKETASNKTCKSACDRMLMGKEYILKTNANDIKVDKSSSNRNHDQSAVESLSHSLGSADSTETIPLVKTLHKRPHTEWYQTDCLIFLSIHAPDITDYYLNVTKDTLVFEAYVSNEHQVLVLNFLGNIEPQHVSHEMRGLKIIVRLVKSFFMEWPRLLEQSTKFSWLSYNYNAIDIEEICRIRPEQRMAFNFNSNFANNESYEDDDADGEEELYQTFTPIINSEDFHDPTADLF